MKEGYTHLAPDPENIIKLHFHPDDPDSEFKNTSKAIFKNKFILRAGVRWQLTQTNLLSEDEHIDKGGGGKDITGRAIEYVLMRKKAI